MVLDANKKRKIFQKTEGRCHICRKQLAWRNYGAVDAANGWEIEHSNPRSRGGSERLRNLFPACIRCNRAKGNSSTRAARRKHGFRTAPPSAEKRRRNAWIGGAFGVLAGRVILASLGPAGALIGLVAGAAIGKLYEAD